MSHDVDTSTELKSVRKLAQMRDELKLQLKLAKAEVRDEWNNVLEPKWKEIQKKVEAAEKVSASAAGEILGAVRLLAKDLGEEYQRLKKAL